MCQVCKEAAKLPRKSALDKIGQAMKKGKDPEHFKAALDRLLGTEEPEQNEALDAAWERAHRRPE